MNLFFEFNFFSNFILSKSNIDDNLYDKISLSFILFGFIDNEVLIIDVARILPFLS